MTMISPPDQDIPKPAPQFRRRRSDVLKELTRIALQQVDTQFGDFSTRLSAALLQLSEGSGDAKEANLSFNLGNLLKNHGYPFLLLATEKLDQALAREIELLEHGAQRPASRRSGDLTLVPFAEMDNRVQMGSSAHLFDIEQADQLAALNSRLANLLQRDTLNVTQNPFRPEVFLAAIQTAWCAFTPDVDAHALLLPLLRPTVFLALGPVYQAINDDLIAHGILPELISTYRIHKSSGNLSAATREASQQALREQLRQRFEASAQTDMPARGSSGSGSGSGLLGRVDTLPVDSPAINQLSRLRSGMPEGSLSRVDEATIDLLSQVFDAVFQDPHIPQEVKELIGFLQIPVLKAALIDQEFFYSESHPARKLIDLMARSGIDWDRNKGTDDPLYRTMKQGIERVRQDDGSDQRQHFAAALDELESYIRSEENAAASALATPITQALKVEKIRTAGRSARNDVAVRIRTGEVSAFVEAFLESRWVTVLTLAHSISDERPEVLTNAIRTMDDLLWSIKPKLTAEHRRELIARLPMILAMLNKWLTVIKWNDADRLRFFADLAECHASIVRAPIDLSPERQVEIAVEVARKAAERRLDLQAREPEEAPADQFMVTVEQLHRGTWLAFEQASGEARQVRLAWVSPLRTLYIFTNGQREEAFSMPADELARQFRESRVRILAQDNVVERALVRALDTSDQTIAEDSA
ncbi:DUF1631 family protein [Actimicrobium sp. CCI2.3]|uniref:DUF1631 family protein n=2 Tax=Bacteria TaxID=2 RepID=UPI002AB56E13|nr:DUF1631 family protein [Actimicrobium sp. CCI2.3]MDY7574566.1 DUF1631 family protein [Actimicrobium sp. CCI2.3]MEB0020942.1 DUF1631 family protein [Actimicrobium sp. CCI2.3]